MSKGNLIIIGASARAAAQSAIRAGYEPWCIDLFADRDLQAIAPVKRCPREQWPQGILELMKDAPPGPVLFTGRMEKHALVTGAICRARPVLGCGVPAISWFHASPRLKNACEAARAETSWGSDINGPHVSPPAIYPVPMSRLRWWLWRRWQSWRGRQFVTISSTGPLRQLWHPSITSSRPVMLQLFLEGTSVSAAYMTHADGVCLLGVTEQLIGDAAFGASPFCYVGNIGPLPGCDRVKRQFEALGDELCDQGITGIFGIDAIADHGRSSVDSLEAVKRITILECNPRYTASVELYEKALGIDVLRFEASSVRPAPDVIFGKAVVYAKSRVCVPDLFDGMPSGVIADVPHVNEIINLGQPICTVFAQGPSRDACYAGLRDMAAKVYTRLQPA